MLSIILVWSTFLSDSSALVLVSHHCLEHTNTKPAALWVKKLASRKVAIFKQILQISDIIQTDSCKFLIEKITGAQNCNFACKFLKKNVISPNYAFFW